jgi:hypothetical protein
MAKAQSEFPKIGKNRTANIGTYRYQYADLSDVLDAVTPVLSSNGLSVQQSTVTDDNGRIGVATLIIHASGQWVSFAPLYLGGGGGKAQDAGSAITYARRYSICAALGIVADEDDDGAIASKKASAPAKHADTQTGRSATPRSDGTTAGTTPGGSVVSAATPGAEVLKCPECGGPAERKGKTLYSCPEGHAGRLA